MIRDLASNSGLKPEPYTIDMSVNLGNASHYNVHDALQGFSVWTEEILGLGRHWFFVMPNLYGKRPDGRPFRCVAIKLSYGTAISWDGRVIGHATSLSKTDAVDGMRVGDVGYYPRNHLFGAFTAAKERVIKVGRALSNATAERKSALASCDKDTGVAPKRKRRKRKKGRQKKSKAHCVDTGPTVKSLSQIPRNNDSSNMLDVALTLCDIDDRDTMTLLANHRNDKK